MRLYKYFSYEGGVNAIRSKRYGFRVPEHFNDPFELTYMYNKGNQNGAKHINSVIDILRKQVCILSLTKSHLNALMWSHYGDSHKGFVIEYDVNDEFLNSSKYNLVPVCEGAVSYASVKPELTATSISESELNDFHNVFLNACGSGEDLPDFCKKFIEQLYLFKHECWSYEDEVRVVKLFDSYFEETAEFQKDPLRSFEVIEKDIKGCTFNGALEAASGLKLFDKVPAKIKAIYLGANNKLLKKEVVLKRLLRGNTIGIENCHGIKVDFLTWKLSSYQINA